jgi:hypothetical protein
MTELSDPEVSIGDRRQAMLWEQFDIMILFNEWEPGLYM